MLAFSGAAGVLAATGILARAAGAPPRRTPGQTLGPFYPLEKPVDTDADLTRIKGRSERALGQVIYVGGRIVNADDEPLSGVVIELWHANSHGRYAHPNDHNPAPLDPNFEGFARLQSDSRGRYRFKTIKPSGYPAGGVNRPPHIHFAFTAKTQRLVTQMYFDGEPLNDGDRQLASAGANRDSLIVTLERPTPDLEPDARVANWDIVLDVS